GGFRGRGAFDSISQGSLDSAAGKTLYSQNCASCHGAVESSLKMGRSASSIANAISSVASMSAKPNLQILTPSEIEMIAAALAPPPAPTGNTKFTCTEPLSRGKSEDGLRRLTYDEYTNTLSDIFGPDVVKSVSSLSGLPLDVMGESVADFNAFHARSQVEALLNTSLELSQKVVANTTYLGRVAPACIGQGLSASNISDSCVGQFVKEFGLKIHRRPLTANQEASYLSVYKHSELSTLSTTLKLQTLMASILQAPEMQFLWTLSPQTVGSGQRTKVDGYTVASRLSYRLTGSSPDATLLQAAANGDLLTLTKVQTQAERLIETKRGRDKVRAMFDHWLRLSRVPTPTVNATTRAGVSGSDSSRLALRQAAISETLDYVEYVIFNMNGTFSDLMKSELAFPKSADLAKLMGTSLSTGTPVMASNGRGGLVMRPAILFSGSDRESPIMRGVSLRTRLLCDPVPSPPASLDTEIADIGNSFDHTQFSSRDVAHKMTGQGSCVGCHARLNSLGFALSFFGPLGEHRTVEQTYAANGQPAKQFAVNANATTLDVISATDTAADHRDLARLISDSAKARSCLATYAFRTSRVRIEAATDNCQLADVEELLASDVPIKKALIKSITSEDILWRGF
ncbi:MAG: DUF1592 domain-containing protein, partial [Bdellovibrionota bacterium]